MLRCEPLRPQTATRFAGLALDIGIEPSVVGHAGARVLGCDVVGEAYRQQCQREGRIRHPLGISQQAGADKPALAVPLDWGADHPAIPKPEQGVDCGLCPIGRASTVGVAQSPQTHSLAGHLDRGAIDSGGLPFYRLGQLSAVALLRRGGRRCRCFAEGVSDDLPNFSPRRTHPPTLPP